MQNAAKKQKYIYRPTLIEGSPTLGKTVSGGNNFTVWYGQNGKLQSTGLNNKLQLGRSDIDPGQSSEGFGYVSTNFLNPPPKENMSGMGSGNHHTCILYGKYTPEAQKSLSFTDVYVWFLLADAIISAVYFSTIGVMQCLGK